MTTTSKITTGLMTAGAVLALTGCAALMDSEATAVARLQPTQGNTATGTVLFTQQGDKVKVDAEVSGLTPGQHGFHVHETGDCSAADGSSAGGHFNPSGKPHGDPAGTQHHVGDMPMLEANAGGHASLHVVLDAMTLTKAPGDIIGKAAIVHQKADDYRTQPTGNAGGRVACGVITAQQP